MKRHITALLLCIIMLFSTLTFASAAVTFSDVPSKAWYKPYVYDAVDLGLFAGTTATTFEPEGNITRAQFVMVLSRIAGADTSKYSVTKFEDVGKKAWYFRAVSWAATVGIVDGTSATTFEPETSVTREQLCTMIVRFANEQKRKMPSGSITQFKDANKIASWAKTAVGQCSAAGLVVGSDGLFSPQDTATRAQAAKILTLFYHEYYEEAKELDVLAITAKNLTIPKFDQNTDYYLCYPKSLSGIQITAVKTRLANPTVSITVEQYCGKTTAARLGDTLDLGYGRARVTITVKTGGKTYTYQLNLTDPNQGDYYYAFLSKSTALRTAASDSASSLVTLQPGTGASAMLYCVGTSGKWTHVQRTSSGNAGQEGWVLTECLTRGYTETDMPNAYKDKLTALQKAHPNWTFTYVDMGIKMSDYAKTVSTNTYGTPSVANVTAAMDPTAYFDEQNIFAFLDVSKYDASQSTSGISNMWVEKSGAAVTKAKAVEYIGEAGKSLSFNPYFIAARAILESGHGSSTLAKGTVSGYEGWYNFYGIGAVDSNPLQGGASYAKNRGWNSPRRAIIEGANWIKDQYVDRGQNTTYFFRFFPYRNAHIYMSDLTAPKSDARLLYTGYSSSKKLLDSKLHFIIPVYRDVDEELYSDVPAKAWYHDYVYEATELGLFTGTGNGTFEPEGSVTRAQFVTVLSRIAAADTARYSVTKFEDVSKKEWYYHEVSWAAENGIVDGTSATTFEPDAPVDREQMCTMLARFSDFVKVTLPKGSVSAYIDKADISSWAKTAVGQCTAAKLVEGSDGLFSPKDTATRAQAAKVLTVYYKSYIA